MPVDPPIQGMLAMLAAMQRPALAAGTPEEARRAFRMLTVDLRPAETIVPVAATEDLEVPGAAGPLPARIYRPEAEGEVPTIVFFHGGGFVIGDVDTHDNQCRALCREAEAVVLSVGYRLAPEHPFPAAPEDCLAATRWAAEHVAELGGDAGRIAVAGDSAGGNLAAVVALMARDAGGPAAGRAAPDLPRHRLRGRIPLRDRERGGVLPHARGHGVVPGAVRRGRRSPRTPG